MRRLIALSIVAVALVLAAAALAANPKKGGSYAGTTMGHGLDKRLTLKVAKNGKTAIANLYCSGKHVSVMKGVKVSKGKFTGLKGKPSFPIWKLSGSFSSTTTAKAVAKLSAICDGGRIPFTLTLASG
jgi:hypothetical protein